ncbi:glycosyltransferase, partial [Geomonas sp.]|uniref:glycosyltransferase n=1 Tax=Geomonas sp. TaxID=2651584 RepID=UPI002B5341C6|nr:hypothetical protein [Geomonas sp.]
ARAYDPDDLAGGIITLLADDGQRAQLAARGRREAEERFSLEKVARHYADLYRELLARGRGGAQ